MNSNLRVEAGGSGDLLQGGICHWCLWRSVAITVSVGGIGSFDPADAEWLLSGSSSDSSILLCLERRNISLDFLSSDQPSVLALFSKFCSCLLQKSGALFVLFTFRACPVDTIAVSASWAFSVVFVTSH